MRARVRRLLALLVLLLGLSAVAVRHAPATTWAVPVQVGPLVGDAVVWSIRRLETEVRVDVGTRDDRATVRIVHRSHPDDHPEARRVAGLKLLPGAGLGRDASAEEVGALADQLGRWDRAWPRSPSFVAPMGARMTPLQRAEAVILDVIVVAWLAGLVLAAGALAPHLEGVGRRTWAGVAGLVAFQQAMVAGFGLHGVWHSNQHGYDRVADVAQLVPPSVAALGLLHGYGFYAVYQPLHALTGVGVLHLAPWVTSALIVATFCWLRAFWDADRPALLGAALLAGMPVVLRLSATESMYVPAALWVVLALWFFELHLRTDRARWLLLGLAPAFLAMQTRAELMLLVPLWLVLLMLARRPGWLRTAWRRPPVVLGLLAAAGLFVPRLLALVQTPPPADLRRSATDPLADPRLLVLAAVGLLGLALWPSLRARLDAAWQRAGRLGQVVVLVVVLTVLLAGGGMYVGALVAQGGPAQRAWQIHPAFDPALTSPLISLAIIAGVVVAARRAPGHLAFLLTGWALAMWIYLPQYDCFATYVRTSLATLPLLAALGGAGLSWYVDVHRWSGGVPLIMALLLVVTPPMSWMTTRYPKQQQWDLVQEIDRRLPDDAVLVWLSGDDVPADAAARGFHTTRARLDHWLPERTTLGSGAWSRGEAPADAPVFFVRTADCHRVLFRPRDDVALAGGDEVAWRYLDRSLIETAPRVAVDALPPDWIDPGCADALAAATEVILEVPLGRADTGSIYETLFGRPALGLYRVPARP